jgi:hypothetical protein
MRTLARSFVALVMLAIGVLTFGGRASASGPPAAICAGRAFYLHAPFPVGGGVWSWATCYGGGAVPWPDADQASWNGAANLIEVRTFANGFMVGDNFEQNRVLCSGYCDSVVAAAPYYPGAAYQSSFRFRNWNDSREWTVWSAAVVR